MLSMIPDTAQMGKLVSGTNPAASEVLVFTSLAELAHVFQVDSTASYAQPKYSNHPTFDALNCGTLCFQVS